MLMLNTIIVLINGFKKIYVPIDVILNVVIIILWPFLQIINFDRLIIEILNHHSLHNIIRIPFTVDLLPLTPAQS